MKLWDWIQDKLGLWFFFRVTRKKETVMGFRALEDGKTHVHKNPIRKKANLVDLVEKSLAAGGNGNGGKVE